MLLCVSVCNIAYIQLALQLETNFVIEWIGESLTTFKTELFKQNTKNSVTASQKAYRLNHVPPIFLHHPTARRLTQVIPIIIHQPGYFSGFPDSCFAKKNPQLRPNLWSSIGPNQRCFPMGGLPNLPNPGDFPTIFLSHETSLKIFDPCVRKPSSAEILRKPSNGLGSPTHRWNGDGRFHRNSNHWNNKRFEKALLEGLPGHVWLSDYDSINYLLYYAYNQIYRSCRMHLPLNRWKLHNRKLKPAFQKPLPTCWWTKCCTSG